MKIVIFSNGQLEDHGYVKGLIGGYDYIICADGGIRHCDAMDISPNAIVGDLDSISTTLLDEYRDRGVEIDRYPTEKDDTDTQIAVDMAIEMGATKIYLLGALGDRWDHSYANVMLLYRIIKNGIEGWILDDKNIITISDSKLRLSAEPGQLLSLLPFGGDAQVASSKGLKYPLKGLRLDMNYPIGMSNEFTDTNVEIIVSRGWVLAIIARD